MIRNILFFSIIILAVSCQDNTTSERTDGYSHPSETREDSLFQQVMDGHDVAMAKMGKLAGYRKQVQQKIDSLAKVPSKAKSSLQGTLKDLETKLKNAEDKMNEWMVEFSIDSAQDDKQRRITYLESEKTKVNKIKDEIFEALNKADSLLKK